MKSIKKYMAVLLAATLILAAFAGCTSKGNTSNTSNNTYTDANNLIEEPLDETPVRLGGLTGPTTIGLVKLLEDAEQGNTDLKIEYKLAGSADELTPLLIKGELDVLAGPANLAAVLYSKTQGKVQMAAVTTLGVLYILTSDESISSWADLKGRTIYATGKGSTPEYNLRYLLTKNGLDPDKDVTIEFKSEPAEIIAMYETSANNSFIAMFPQPYASVAATKYPELKQLFDLSAEWDKLGEKSKMITACLMVRKEFAEEHPQVVNRLIDAYRDSAKWVNSNVKDAAALTEKYIGVKAAIAEKAIPLCNIVCLTVDDMSSAVSPYFKVLFDQNPASVGGALPGEDFYY